MGYAVHAFCCLLPTSVFVTPTDLKIGKKLLLGCDCVMTITPYSSPIERALRVKNNKVLMVNPNNYNLRSQDCEQLFHDAGQFYWVKTRKFEDKLYLPDTIGMIYEESKVQDIDTEEDWKMAEIKYGMV